MTRSLLLQATLVLSLVATSTAHAQRPRAPRRTTTMRPANAHAGGSPLGRGAVTTMGARPGRVGPARARFEARTGLIQGPQGHVTSGGTRVSPQATRDLAAVAPGSRSATRFLRAPGRVIDRALRQAGPNPAWRRGASGVETLRVELPEPVGVTTARGNRVRATRTVEIHRSGDAIVGVEIVPQRGGRRIVPTVQALEGARRGPGFQEREMDGQSFVSYTTVEGAPDAARGAQLALSVRATGATRVIEPMGDQGGTRQVIQLNSPVSVSTGGREVQMRWALIMEAPMPDGRQSRFVMLGTDMSDNVTRDARDRLRDVQRVNRERAVTEATN